MSKINILDSSIYNRISAGEVVERPSSVVKELIENSLDAKANSITIEIENGGINLIKITDNGSGIDFDDMKKVFLPHATSKVSKLEDLDEIETFGFRGEALASIASVSKVEIYSNTSTQECGGKVFCQGGKIETVESYATPVGTIINVKNLFYNTPARYKFLKTPKQEESLITNIVNRLMLANPQVFFKYIVDGKLIYNAKAPTLKDKIFTIYGKQVLENLIEINYKKNDCSVTGFISKPTYCKANKTYQTLLVNNRYVINNLVGVAVANAYENFLMKGKFPFFVLNLKIDFSDVDVNVHPSKMEVKFKNSNSIYSLIYSIILETLNNNNFPVNYESLINPGIETKKIETENINTEKLKKIEGGFSFSSLNSIQDRLSKITVSVPSYTTENSPSTLNSSNYNLSNINDNLVDNEEMTKKLFKEDSSFINNPNNETFSQQEKFELNIDYKLVGTFFNTYIVIEHDENVYFIDQHAGHERVLYDNFINEYNNKKIVSQELLIPYIFNVNELEDDLIKNSLDVFNQLGFTIENFGLKTYKITSVPAILNEINLDSFIFDCLKKPFKVSSENETIKNHFATSACKAAVKGGQKLSDNEIKMLLNLIIKNKTTLLCPHGRPICIKLTKYDIEKMFKRVI